MNTPGDNINGIRDYLRSCATALTALGERAEAVAAIIDKLVALSNAGGKIMTCGNGGSAAEAMHLSEELMGRYRRTRPPIAAICLNSDPTALTCIANDWEFAEVFARQVAGIGRLGDALVVLSTSGKSPSILRALERARSDGLTTIGLLGPAGSPAESLCDLALTLPATVAASHVQEMHLVFIHLLLERFDALHG